MGSLQLSIQFKMDYISPGHRTGEPAFAALRKAFGDRISKVDPDRIGLWLLAPIGRYTCGIMAHRCWNESYAAGELPWDTGEPEPLLVEFITSGRIQPTRTLEIGAGTGTNAIWLAERGFEVLGVDVAPIAVEQAKKKLIGRDLPCCFVVLDILTDALEGGPFEFVFDRGCFHVFDEAAERARFAARVAAALAPGGLWLSLIGSTESGPREMGPPQRSGREVILAIEPALAIQELRAAEFRDHGAKAWFCLSRSRAVA
jgi:SAM-dependent methyltransferase